MKTLLSLSIICLLSVLSASAQMSSKVNLPFLQLTNEAVGASLTEVSKYISDKPKGMNFPVSKAKFVKVKGGYSIEVEGIDNSWRNLFKPGEASYGYTIVRNRLYIVMGNKDEEIDLRDIFWMEGTVKSFARMHLPSTLATKNPKWYFEFVEGVSTKIRDEDLDVLGK